MRARTICATALVAASAACAAAKPHTFGAYNEFAVRVAPQQGERIPQHLTVQLNKPANVAIFQVVPGSPSKLLFPADSSQTGYIAAGPHLVETAYARQALGDTSRLARRTPAQTQQGQRPPQGQGRGRNGQFDPNGLPGLNMHSYILVYASQEPLPYNVLATRVGGISIPIDDDDALNTVTKLIRETTRTSGTWAAYAMEFVP